MITTIVFLFGRDIFVRLSFGEMVVGIPHKMRRTLTLADDDEQKKKRRKK